MTPQLTMEVDIFEDDKEILELAQYSGNGFPCMAESQVVLGTFHANTTHS